MRITHHVAFVALAALLTAGARADDARPAGSPAAGATQPTAQPTAQQSLVDAIMRSDAAAMNAALRNGAVLSNTSAASKDAIEALLRVGTAEVYAAAAKAGIDLHDRETNDWSPRDLQLCRPSARTSDVKYLLDQGFRIDGGIWDDRSLQSPAAARNVEIARLLLDRGAEINPPMSRDGYTPLTFAIAAGSPEVVRLLHSKGATPDDDGMLPFTAALAQPDPAAALTMLRLVAELGYKPNEDMGGHTPLMLAVRRGKTQAAAFLIAAGANVNFVGEGKMTALHYAAGSGSIESIAALIAAKADINAPDDRRNTPLHHAIRAADAVSMLDIGRDRSEHLMEAVDSGSINRDHLAAIRLLVEAGADVNAVDSYGYAPLNYAVSAGDPFWVTRDARDRVSSSWLKHLGRELCERFDAAALVRLLIERGAVRRNGVNAIDPLQAAILRSDHRAGPMLELLRTAKVDSSPQPKPEIEWDQGAGRPASRKPRTAPMK